MGRISSAEKPLSDLEIEIEVQIAPPLTGTLASGPLQRVAQDTLLAEGVLGQVTLVITDDKGIRALNRHFLGLDTPTDVLAFSARENGGDFVMAPGTGGYLGDVIISYSRAIDQAHDQGHPVHQELCLLIIHGMLHLLGYDHETEEQKTAMWARQKTLLAQVAAE